MRAVAIGANWASTFFSPLKLNPLISNQFQFFALHVELRPLTPNPYFVAMFAAGSPLPFRTNKMVCEVANSEPHLR